MTTKNRAPLTDLDIEVLRGARDGQLYRSEAGHDLYSSYLKAFGRTTKVNRQVDKLSYDYPDADQKALIRIGERVRFHRSWSLTEAGEAELAKRTES